MSSDSATASIHVLMPQPLAGSGGHRTVVDAAEALAHRGHRVTLHVEGDAALAGTRHGERLLTRTRDLHGVRTVTLSLGWPDRIARADLILATTWRSALAVHALDSPAVRAHFVQDYEAWFSPHGDESVAAASAHDLSLQTIVIGDWLPHWLWQQHRLPTWSIPFTADVSLYRPGVLPRSRRIVAMFQPEKPRRCPRLMTAGLQEILDTDPQIEVVTVGSRLAPRLTGHHSHLGVVDTATLAELYRTSYVGLSMSATNPSRVPFEMMAAGLPVVELGASNNTFDLPQDGCLLAHPDPGSVAEALRTLLADDALREQLSLGGVGFMADRPRDQEHAAFVDAVAAILAGAQPGEPNHPRRYRAAFVTAPSSSPWDGGPPETLLQSLRRRLWRNR